MSTLSNFGIAGVGHGIMHPKLKNKWRVTFTGLGLDATTHKDVSMQATTVSRPQLEFAEVEIHRYNSTAYVGGKHTWSPMSLTIEDDVTGKATRVLKAQIDKQQHLLGVSVAGRSGDWLSTGRTGSDYKFGAKLEQLDGDEAVVETWNLEGAWIQSIDFGDLDYSASEAATIQLTLRYDHASSSDVGGEGLGTALGGASV